MARKARWDKPLKIVTEYDLKSLRGLLASKAPIGKPRPKGFTVRGKRYTYRNPPPAPGQLRKSFYRKGAVTLSRDGKRVLIESDVPYARAVDKGHRAFTVRPVRAEYLMFKAGGKVVFTKKARIPRTSGKKFVKAAANEWRKRRGIKPAIRIRWKPYKGGVSGAGAARARGMD